MLPCLKDSLKERRQRRDAHYSFASQAKISIFQYTATEFSKVAKVATVLPLRLHCCWIPSDKMKRREVVYGCSSD